MSLGPGSTPSGLTPQASAETATWVATQSCSQSVSSLEHFLAGTPAWYSVPYPFILLHYLRAKLLHSSSDSPNTIEGPTELDGYILLFRVGNKGPERLSNLLKVTQHVRDRTQIINLAEISVVII